MIYGETQVSIKHAIDAVLAPLLIGQDSFALGPIWRSMGALAANLAAKSAIDIALHDLNGKLTGLPVHRLLGGPERSHVDLVWMIGLMDERAMIDEAVTRAGEGFRAFKVKGGIDPAFDIRVARALREALPEAQIYIDANRNVKEKRPVDETCDCLCCTRYSRAYLHHLFNVDDHLAFRLATIHNVRFYTRLMEMLRAEDRRGQTP